MVRTVMVRVVMVGFGGLDDCGKEGGGGLMIMMTGLGEASLMNWRSFHCYAGLLDGSLQLVVVYNTSPTRRSKSGAAVDYV